LGKLARAGVAEEVVFGVDKGGIVAGDGGGGVDAGLGERGWWHSH